MIVTVEVGRDLLLSYTHNMLVCGCEYKYVKPSLPVTMISWAFVVIIAAPAYPPTFPTSFGYDDNSSFLRPAACCSALPHPTRHQLNVERQFSPLSPLFFPIPQRVGRRPIQSSAADIFRNKGVIMTYISVQSSVFHLERCQFMSCPITNTHTSFRHILLQLNKS